MASILFVWPTDPEFHPEEEQELRAKQALQDALVGSGDVDCDSYPEPRPHEDGSEPYEARFVLRACNVEAVLSAEKLDEVSRALGCACKQSLLVDRSAAPPVV